MVPDLPLDAANLRLQAIAALERVIYLPTARPDTPAQREEAASSRLSVHDPALRRRTTAVEMLGRIADRGAVEALADLLLRRRQAGTVPRRLGRWLRDTALLTLLRSPHLPGGAVDATLRMAYSFLRYPLPWQWTSVYDDLPLLRRYNKLPVFFHAFWLWPLLILAVPTLVFVLQLLIPAFGVVPLGGGDWGVALGTGLEIYLVHQVLVALLAGQMTPAWQRPGYVPGPGQRVAGVALAVGVAGLLALALVIFLLRLQAYSQDGVSVGRLALQAVTVILPLLLLPMFILAHELEQAVRYGNGGRGLRLGAWVLRRETDLAYIFALPALAGVLWHDLHVFGPAIVLFLLYLFSVPFLVTGGQRLLTSVLAPRRRRLPPGGGI